MTINKCLGLIITLLMIKLASSTYIADGVLTSHRSVGRSLLQAQKNCPVNFENQNYTVMTSQCKGPKYPQEACCKAFKEFACPFTDDLNDLSNNCASTMFSYINLYGKYPPGLFANECKEGKEGLKCDNVVSKASTNHARTTKGVFSSVLILASALVFSFWLI